MSMYWSDIHALKRIGECVEVANGMVFLASDEVSFITGHGLAIDGGASVYGGRYALLAQMAARAYPFDETWINCQPPAHWAPPSLPAGWNDIT